MAARRVKCRGCGARFTASSVGRPPVYCSTVCRRSAEYDVRRTQALLKRAEMKVQDAELQLALGEAWHETRRKKVLEFWEAEVDRLRDALRAELAGVETTEGDSDGMG